MTDFTELRNTVPHFPADLLAHATPSGPVKGGDVDWLEVDRLDCAT